jgi:hypothetical protein
VRILQAGQALRLKLLRAEQKQQHEIASILELLRRNGLAYFETGTTPVPIGEYLLKKRR